MRISVEDINNTEKILKDKNEDLIIEEQVLKNIDALNILYGIKEKPYIQKVVVWNKLYKKEVLNNIIFEEGKLHEDEFTTHKILYNMREMVSSNRYIHGYMQTKNSIMRAEISEKRIKDNLDASLEALKFFKAKKLDNIQAKVMLRYLSNCIELSGKIYKEQSFNKLEKLDIIEKRFLQFFPNVEYIKNYIDTDLEKEVLDLLILAYLQIQEKHNLNEFWEKLSYIIK